MNTRWRLWSLPERLPSPRPLRVVAVPRARNRDINPYNTLLYDALDDIGIDALEGNALNLLGQRPDIVHIHWPEYLFSARSTWRALVNAATFMAVIAYFGARKVRIVWTVHNLSAHEAMHPRLEQRMWRWFVRRVDAMISMSPTGQRAALDRYPELAETPRFVIPHGHYSNIYPADADRETARAWLGIGDQPLVCFFGSVRTYKGVPSLLRAFRRMASPEWRLVVAGNCTDPDLRDTLLTEAGGDDRIDLRLSFVPDGDVQYYLRAADLVVLPYRDTLNSGSAILALTFGAHVLVPGKGAANDLAAVIGPDWIRTYSGELTPEILEDAVVWARERRTHNLPPLDALAWERIAEQTRQAYRVVMQSPPSRIRRRKARISTRRTQREWTLSQRIGAQRPVRKRSLRRRTPIGALERHEHVTLARRAVYRHGLTTTPRSLGDQIGLR